MPARRSSTLAFLLVACGTALGIAGTDMVLPAVPSLPSQLGGTAEQAQFVLAAYTAGAAIGLLGFGELGARYDQRRLLFASLLGYGLASLACTFSASLTMLTGLRFVQGAAGSAAAVFAPGILRAIYGDARAVRALGALGSLEALAPALAPILGAGLLGLWGWRASFDLIGALALALAVVLGARPDMLPASVPHARKGSYSSLLRARAFLGHALGYAFILGALLVFVFGAPAVFTRNLSFGLAGFIALQVCGIIVFAIAANLTGRLVVRFGSLPVIWGGSLMSAAGALAMLGYALSGGDDLITIIAFFAVLNGGLGFRGAPGFHAAILAARGDDARGSALVVLAILGIASIGTSAIAPFIDLGLPAIAGGAAILACAGLLALLVVPAVSSNRL
jgi:MFS transporter, DHA1 family, multidrug resistance protein